MTRIKWEKTIGQTINGFLIENFKRENNRSFVLVVCPFCKKKKWIRTDEIKKNKSCGCYNKEHNLKKPLDITNMQFGRLKAIKPTQKRDKNNGSIIWECECKCGNIKLASAGDLISKKTISCNCLGKENSKINGKKVGKYIVDNFCIEHTNIKNLTMKKSKRNKSGIKGVCYDTSRKKWKAQIRFKNKNYFLGRYNSKEEAAQIRKEAEEKIFGSFLTWYNENFPQKINHQGGKKNETKRN